MTHRDEITITYGIEDGYAGPARPHQVTIPLDELTDCETEDEVSSRIDQIVEDHFRETISTYWDRDQLAEVMPLVEAARDDEDRA
jgi:hypothetical protein